MILLPHTLSQGEDGNFPCYLAGELNVRKEDFTPLVMIFNLSFTLFFDKCTVRVTGSLPTLTNLDWILESVAHFHVDYYIRLKNRIRPSLPSGALLASTMVYIGWW